MINRIKQYRKLNNLTQEDLANIVGTSRQTINAIENDKYDPSLKLAAKISFALDATIETIFKLNDLD